MCAGIQTKFFSIQRYAKISPDLLQTRILDGRVWDA